MTFLQPWVLLGLPLVLVPIIIHLLNRLRHRPKPWAAMRFLVSATRSSASHSRCGSSSSCFAACWRWRCSILFLARPLAGGWLGWALFARARRHLDSAGPFGQHGNQIRRHAPNASRPSSCWPRRPGNIDETSHLFSLTAPRASRRKSPGPPTLNQLSSSPADGHRRGYCRPCCGRAFDWLIDNRAGTAEIWIASDGQRSNWLPEDPRWKNVIAQLGSLSRKVRVRLLEMNQPPEANASSPSKNCCAVPAGGSPNCNFFWIFNAIAPPPPHSPSP